MHCDDETPKCAKSKPAQAPRNLRDLGFNLGFRDPGWLRDWGGCAYKSGQGDLLCC